jgi:hypothetical protein
MIDDSRIVTICEPNARENNAPLFHPNTSTSSAQRRQIMIESYRCPRNSQKIILAAVRSQTMPPCSLTGANPRLKLLRTYRILAPFQGSAFKTKEKAMRKVLLLALVSMFLATACSKSEETAPAPDAAASAAAPAPAESAAAAPSAADAGSPAAATSPAAP